MVGSSEPEGHRFTGIRHNVPSSFAGARNDFHSYLFLSTGRQQTGGCVEPEFDRWSRNHRWTKAGRHYEDLRPIQVYTDVVRSQVSPVAGLYRCAPMELLP